MKFIPMTEDEITKAITIAQDRIQIIKKAVDAQAEDETLWGIGGGASEAYMRQSLRWLHRVIEDGDQKALESIIAQSKDEI